MKDLLRKIHDGSPAIRGLVRSWRANAPWPDLGPGWKDALRAAAGPSVLLATSSGLAGASMERLLAVALTLRGARVAVFLCDGVLPACMEAHHQWGRGENLTEGLCDDCFAPAARMFYDLGIPVLRYSDFDGESDVAVDQHAMAGALRYFARGTIVGEPDGERVYQAYLRAAVRTAAATKRLLETHDFACAAFHHGVYVPQGVIGEVARSRGVRVVNWNPAFRRGTFLFSHGDTYHRTMMDEPRAAWESMEWTPEKDARLMDYLHARREGRDDWIFFHEKPRGEPVVPAGPVIGLLTNVAWDAQVHYPQRAFPNMMDWIRRTIEYFARRPEVHLLIRVHPAEANGRIVSRQPVMNELAALPSNVTVIGPKDPVSTYDLMDRCDSVLIYGTKTGVELTARGIPVVVAGEAWIRNKGLTLDAASAEDYFRILDRLPIGRRMSVEQTTAARKYAHHFFFRRMIPIDCVRPVEGARLFEMEPDLERIRNSRGLGVICEGILHGKPFVYD